MRSFGTAPKRRSLTRADAYRSPPPYARKWRSEICISTLRCIGLRKLLLLVQFLWSDFFWRRSLQFGAISARR